MQTRIQRELLPKANERRLRVPMLAENDGSVVLGIRVGAASVLLGADLEEKNRRGLGWQVILDGCQPGEPKYGGFKIPHHGSETGHHPSTWPTMMTPDAWAAVTPFNRQKDPLPRKEDCVRILQMTEHAYITAPAGFGRFRHSDSAVQKTMAEAALAIGTELSKQGHIRFRKSCTDSAKAWSTELFGNAVHLREYLAMAK